MNALIAFPFAAAVQPLFGSQWLALAVVLAGVAVFMAVVAGVGRWLAATHPDAPRRPVAPPVPTGPSPEVLAVIAAAVAVTAGPRARIAAVELAKAEPPSVEMLMQQWSVEGRRQIYSSHQVR